MGKLVIPEVLARKDFPEEGCCIRKSQKRTENSAGILGGARVPSHDSPPYRVSIIQRIE